MLGLRMMDTRLASLREMERGDISSGRLMVFYLELLKEDIEMTFI